MPKITIVAGGELDDPKGKLWPLAATLKSISSVRQWWWRTEPYGVVRELHNCYQRIRVRYRLGLTHSGRQTDPALHRCKTGNREDCIETRARIADIQRLFALRTWSTVLDADLFSAGWELGAEWMRGNFDKRCCVEREASNSPGISILGCNESQQP